MLAIVIQSLRSRAVYKIQFSVEIIISKLVFPMFYHKSICGVHSYPFFGLGVTKLHSTEWHTLLCSIQRLLS